MKILITGSSGFIGSHLVKQLSKNDLFCYDLQNGDDILDTERLKKRMMGCDVVVHLAAKVSQKESLQKPAFYYLHNIEGTKNVVEVALACGIKRFIFASSAAAYSPFDNPYALSKWVGEEIVRRMFKKGSAILRFFNVYGEEDIRPTVIPVLVNKIKKGETINICGDGQQIRDFVHVDDVCKAIKQMIYHANPPEPLDVGTGQSYSIVYLAYLIMGLVGKRVSIRYTKARKEIRDSCASPAFTTDIKLIDGIKRFL